MASSNRDLGKTLMLRWLSAVALSTWLTTGQIFGDDWPMGGRTTSRNPVSLETNAPTDWKIDTESGRSLNVRWSAKTGSRAVGGPVIANGLVWVGTNNANPRDTRVTGDHSVLACFRERDGQFLYQYLCPRKADSYVNDWPQQSLAGSPVIEGDRLWFCTNRGEVVCLDISPLLQKEKPPRVVWKTDFAKDLGVFVRALMIPSGEIHCSPAVYRDFVYVSTGNGVADDCKTVPAPMAPSLICLRKDTGKVIWSENSPGKELRFGQYASPLVAEIGGQAQVIAPQGDGWVRSFDAASGKLLWKFNCNRKGLQWKGGGGSDREVAGYVLSTPVLADGRVYFTVGRHAEDCVGTGRVCCIDPRKRGDISADLDDGLVKEKPNPNSGLIWESRRAGNDPDEQMHFSLSSVAVNDGLAIAADFTGFIHCLDAKTGVQHWTHNTKANIFGNPLVVDGKVYVGTDGGDVWILALNKTKNLLARRDFDWGIAASPVFANGSLFVLTEGYLYAIGRKP